MRRGWSPIRWYINIQSCCCPFSSPLEGSRLLLTSLLTARCYPTGSKSPSSEELRTSTSSIRVNPDTLLHPYGVPKKRALLFIITFCRGSTEYKSRTKNSGTGMKGGCFCQPHPAPMQTEGTWLIAVLQQEGWPVAKHMAMGLSLSC